MCLFSRAAIPESHRLYGLNNRNSFSHSSGGWNPEDQSAIRAGLPSGLSSWLADAQLLAMSSHSFFSACMPLVCLPLLIRTLYYYIRDPALWLYLTLITSLNVVFKCSDSVDSGFNIWILRRHISVHDKVIVKNTRFVFRKS